MQLHEYGAGAFRYGEQKLSTIQRSHVVVSLRAGLRGFLHSKIREEEEVMWEQWKLLLHKGSDPQTPPGNKRARSRRGLKEVRPAQTQPTAEMSFKSKL